MWDYLPLIIIGALVVIVLLFWIFGGKSDSASVAPPKSAESPKTVPAPPVAATTPKTTGKKAATAKLMDDPKPASKTAPAKAQPPLKAAATKATPTKAPVKPAAAAPKTKPAARKAAAPKTVVPKATAPKTTVAKVAPPKATAKTSVKAAPKAKTDAIAKAKVAPKAATKAATPKAAPKPKAAAKRVIPDNLELLKGVGPKVNTLLKSMGITSFDQVANWAPADIAEIDAKLGTFAGRIGRDNWVDQAKLLVAGDVAGFEKKYGALGSEIAKR